MRSEASIGLFGKLPARGDFVRLGLPRDFVAPWDAWLCGVLASSRARLGAAWMPAWLEAPVWRFALAENVCGEAAVLGLMLPGIDRVGRPFPLTLAAVGRVPDVAAAEPWLDGCEAAGRAAIERDATPEEVLALVPPLPISTAADPTASLWWTDGGPRVAATRMRLSGLPDDAGFAAMLGAA